MTRWDIDLSKTGNQAKTIKKILNTTGDVVTETLYVDSVVGEIAYNDTKDGTEVMTYSDYTGYQVHYGGEYPETAGINVLACDEISYPITQTATNITSTSFIANWSRLINMTYLLDVSVSPVFATFLVGYNALEITSGDNYKNITGLSANTNYYYRVRCKSQWNDISRYSNIKLVTTLP